MVVESDVDLHGVQTVLAHHAVGGASFDGMIGAALLMLVVVVVEPVDCTPGPGGLVPPARTALEVSIRLPARMIFLMFGLPPVS